MRDPDGDLTGRAQAGDQHAFEELVRRHADRLYAAVARLVADRHEAEDVTRQAFLRAWRSLDRFRGESQFSIWLYRIGVNEARRRRERRTRGVWRAMRRLDADPLASPDRLQAPHGQAARRELHRALEPAIDASGADVLLCTRTGIAWRRRVDATLAVNVGAAGRPANDGRCDTWYAVLDVDRGRACAQLVPVAYEWRAQAASMRAAGLPEPCVETIETALA